MRLPHHASLLFLLFIVFLAVARAQDDPSSTERDNSPSSTRGPASTATSGRAASTASDESATSTDNESSSATDATESNIVTNAPSATTTGGSSNDGAGVITDGAAATGGIPTYSPAAVPNTGDAPFMQKSNLPQGTVFICVGAVIGFFFLLVVAWRGMVAYSLRRSIKKANTYGYANPAKDYSTGGVGKNIVAPFYTQGPSSNLSLDPLTAGAKANGKGGRGSFIPQSTSSLFFSPTAGAGMQPGANRGSGYLPAGYYSAGASAPGGGNGRPISMADFANQRPGSSGYQRARNYESPAPSPNLLPNTGHNSPYGNLTPAGVSTSSLNGRDGRGAGRAPSTFLDEMFDYTPAPRQGPPRY